MTPGPGIALQPSGASTGDRRWPLHRAWMIPFAGAGILFLSLWFPSLSLWNPASRPRILGGVNDFMGIYAGGRLAGTPEQFNAEAYIREQVRATGWAAPSILYTRPPAFAVLLRPLGRLDYPRAYVVWQTLSIAAFAGFLILWPAPDRALLLCAVCWSFPVLANFVSGQDIGFLALFLAIAWRLGPSRPIVAGAVLGLATLKFHLFLLIAVFLFAQRRWRMFAGACMTTGVILAVSFLVAGPKWMPEYARFVLQGQTNPSVLDMPNLHGLLEGLPHSLAWEVACAVLVAIAVGFIAQRTNFSVGLSAALAGSILTSHHAYSFDLLLLLPALLTLAAEFRSVLLRILCILLLSPLPFRVTPLGPLAGPVPLLLLALLAVVAVSVAHASSRSSLA